MQRDCVIMHLTQTKKIKTTEKFPRFFPTQFNYSVKTTSRTSFCLEKYISVYSTWVFLE